MVSPPILGDLIDSVDAPRRTGSRGQSEVIGVVLLLAITILGTVAIVAIGSGSLADTQERADMERTEHAMTALDSRSVLVALDNAGVQTVDLGDSGDGTYVVEDDSGWLRVVHHNYTTDGGSDEVIYNATLGAVVYRNGERSIAYQGGGVWRGDGDGSVMVSPPEFHYRAETLTLPVVQIAGSDAVSGPATATVTAGDTSIPIYPNDTAVDQGGDSDTGAPYGSSGRPYANPVQNGAVTVTVRSEYYQAWAAYFQRRTEGTVSVDAANRTATVELTASGTMGDFEMPREGDSIEVRGLKSAHAVRNFTVVLAPDDTDSARFNNLQWSMYADSGNRQLEYHLRNSGEFNDPTATCDRQTVSVTVYYSETNGNRYHGWHNATTYRTECVDRDDDGVRDEVRLVANLTGPMALSTSDLRDRDLQHYNPSGSDRLSSYEFDEHPGVGWEPTSFSDGSDDEAALTNLTNHYLTLVGPNFDLTVDDQNSDTINEDASWGTLVYDGSGRVTFMHITENHVRINLTG